MVFMHLAGGGPLWSRENVSRQGSLSSVSPGTQPAGGGWPGSQARTPVSQRTGKRNSPFLKGGLSVASSFQRVQ